MEVTGVGECAKLGHMEFPANPTPEARARVKIDALLSASGWQVVPRDAYSQYLSAAAIEEGILKGGLEADYLLFLDGKCIGVLEAKKKGTDLEAVAVAQAENYTRKVPDWVKVWFPGRPLPLVCLSDGDVLLVRDDDGAYVPCGKMPTPAEVASRFALDSFAAGYPFLSSRGLRTCQMEALSKLEASFRAGNRKSLLVLATGAGKTFTACMAVYRLLTYAKTRGKRVLFLVDRNNLGEQTEGEFGKFRLTETGAPFTDIYVTQRLKSHQIGERTNLLISTIQRLYAMLTGQEMLGDEEEDEADRDAEAPAVTLGGDARLPHDFFDAIVIDECHRSIYGRWRAVLDYFDTAKFIGLTATPTPDTEAFFDHNKVYEYSLEKSIADGVNVDYRVYRIQTDTTTNGGEIAAGEEVKVVTRLTGSVERKAAAAGTTFGANDLDRSVVSPAQIRLVLEQYRDAVYRDLYVGDLHREPDFALLPKTLVFAKDENHAREIVRIAREVFPGQAPDFVQNITYSAGNPQQLIREFRNSRTFRMAVTVTLIATGTDVRPLEVLLFMRDIHSEQLYQQMRGRGVRSLKDDELLAVTPNAKGGKQLFFLVDAVGVTTSEKHLPKRREGDGPEKVPSLAELLELLAHGNLGDDNLRLAASRLSRLNARTDESQHLRFASLTDGRSMKDLADDLFDALEGGLPPFEDLNAPNAARAALVAPLFVNPGARAYLLELNAGYQTILMPGHDAVIYTGFSQEEAKIVTDAFKDYLTAHSAASPVLAALRDHADVAPDPASLEDLDFMLGQANHRFTIPYLWDAYRCLDPQRVTPFSETWERTALTNWIPVCRRGFGDDAPLRSLTGQAARFYELWRGQQQRGGLAGDTDAVMREVLRFVVSSGAQSRRSLFDAGETALVARGSRAFGSVDAFDHALRSLSRFILNH